MEPLFNEHNEYFTPEEYEIINKGFGLVKAKKGLVLPIEVIESFSKEELETFKNTCFIEGSGRKAMCFHVNTLGEMADAWKTYVNTVHSLLISELNPMENSNG